MTINSLGMHIWCQPNPWED